VSRGGRLEYTMLYNATMTRGNDLLTLLNLFTNAIYRVVTGTTAPVKFQGTMSFPAPRSEITFDLQSQIGPLLYVYVFNLLLPVFVVSLVAEKEQGLVQIMRQSGLPDRVYAVVTYLFFLILYVLATGIVILVASILRFRFFIANDIGIVLLFFFVWGHTLIAVSYLFAVFFGKSRTATIVMYLWTFITGILSGQLVINFFQSPDTPPAINGALMIVPTFVMFRGLIDLSKFTSNGGTGMTWEDLSSGAASNMLGAFTAMPIMWAVCLVLAWYLGNVLPGAAGGAPKSPLFFLPKALRTLCVRGAPDSATTDIRRALVKEADDVVVERLRTERHAERDHATHNLVRADVPRSHELQAAAARDDDFHRAHVPPAVRMYNLRKTFTSRDGKPFVAVNGVSMSLFRGQCLGLVGPNGAGKSTLIAMLSGQLKPTSGEAFVEDDSIVEDLENIYRHMGVCPQNDVLWADLTAAETLKFYATLKGLTGRARDDHVEYWLEQVDLVAARNRVTSTYSGGMRRRLCVACSMIGGPHTVFLDEPSASLDPASRHRLWDVIKANKSTTTMLLTTHSMAEAQELCDRVGIFVDGKMRAIGSPDFLQAKYGAHLKVAITTLPDRGSVSRGQSVLRKITNEARMVSSLAGTSNFEISRGSANLSTLFRQLGIAVEKGDILDFGVGNTSLEEVFVQILFVSQDDKKKGKGGGSGGGDLQRSASKGNLDYIGGDDDSIDDIVELRDDDVDADVPMQNIVAPAVQRSQSQRPQSMRRSEAFSEELGDGELEEVRAKLERAETARSGRLLERANTARSERDLARSNTMRSLSMRRRIENGEEVDLVERAPDDDPALIVEEGRALSRAPSRRATIRVTDDIVLDLSVSDSEGEYPLIVDDTDS
jgi:ABC-type multidrug transport system ATPase subunit